MEAGYQVPGAPSEALAVPGLSRTIRWKDTALASAMEELRSNPEDLEALESLGSEYLAAAFLTRCGFNKARAQEAFARTAQWRQSSGSVEARARLLSKPDMKFCDFPHGAKVLKYLPQCEGGPAIDKRGLPYAIRCMGIADATGLFSTVTEEQLVECQVYLSEWRLLQLEAHAAETGEISGITIVQDVFAPLGLLAMWRKHGGKSGIMRKVVAMIDEHYPGVMGSVLLVNAPWAIHAILKVLKPVLPERIANKIQLIPPAETPQRLLELVEEKHLPRWLGGEGTDSDFVPNRAALLTTDADVVGPQLVVAAGKKEERGLWLSEGDNAAFGCSVAGGVDIMFSCRFDVEEAGTVVSEEVHAPARLKEEDSGASFTAPRRGRLVLVFDNSYSWVKPKQISYELGLVTNQEESAETPKRESAEVQADS
eukprot:TRINITY_DN30870_c0_g1_i1.p1 TRINITY_DN30870_c0_g1~~TRINITY_DN30870_c0_g1_i1.p1  ORF type:complete len:440 (-),score=83.81 TRINITY_DN30870_c0_g1_i1:21-1295(-)